jgi:hypothetical protein
MSSALEILGLDTSKICKHLEVFPSIFQRLVRLLFMQPSLLTSSSSIFHLFFLFHFTIQWVHIENVTGVFNKFPKSWLFSDHTSLGCSGEGRKARRLRTTFQESSVWWNTVWRLEEEWRTPLWNQASRGGWCVLFTLLKHFIHCSSIW